MPVDVDDGLEDKIWVRGLDGDRLPAAFYALRPNLKKVILPSEGGQDFLSSVFYIHASGQMFVYQTPGRRPPHITGVRVNSVTLGWVGATYERATFRFITQSLVLSIDVCRGLGISPVRSRHFAEIFLRPRLPRFPPGIVFFVLFFEIQEYSYEDSGS